MNIVEASSAIIVLYSHNCAYSSAIIVFICGGAGGET